MRPHLRQPDDIAHFLSGINYPCSKDDLIMYAKAHDATTEVLGILNNMPDITYYSLADVFEGFEEIG